MQPRCQDGLHTHPVGQALYILYGSRRVQTEDSRPTVINPGDTVSIPPNVKHWHGAAQDPLFTHLAFQGAGTRWLEKV